MTNSERDGLLVLGLEWFSGGLSSAITSAILNPMDVAKTRMQVSNSGSSQQSSLRRILYSIYRSDGIVGLWKPGLSASMAREMLYSGPRAGFYVPIRNEIISKLHITNGNENLTVKILSALVTGTLGALIANLVDVVKIRLMVDSKTYKSVWGGIHHIIRHEGVGGLYKGLLPSTLRGASIGVGELATYDHSKVVLKRHLQLEEGIILHSISSLITGIVATTVAAPFDLLKSRAMNARHSSSAQTHTGMLHLAKSIVQTEGVLVLFRGWVPSYLRLGPHAMICFPLFEQMRYILDLDYV